MDDFISVSRDNAPIQGDSILCACGKTFKSHNAIEQHKRDSTAH